MYYIISLFILILAFLACWYFEAVVFKNEDILSLKDASSDLENIFINIDANNDGVLNLEEFLSLKNSYNIFYKKPFSIKQDYEVQEFPEIPIVLGEQVINIDVKFEPLTLSSMTKNMSNLTPNELAVLSPLLNWKTPYKERHPFGAKSFSIFLPPKSDVASGFTWRIIEASEEQLDNARYFPPLVKRDHLLIHSLLSLFHPRVFLQTRFHPQGAVAVIRAESENYYDIVFRIHAEFQLSEPPALPFWFTPSQFQGRLVINKDGTVVKFFELLIPYTKLNVDMEWFNSQGEENMEVDIGHIPEMSLISTAISVPLDSERGTSEKISDIKWTSEISEKEATENLEQQFFSFRQVKYYDLPEAFEVASSESKLVHGIILWGNLADQSC